MPEKKDITNQPGNLRKKAEKKLRQLTPQQIHALSALNSREIIHELQVHQIELEMQNEELRANQEELEVSRAKYAELYDFAPLGYFIVSEKGIIESVNLTGARQLEIERKLLITQPFILFVHKDDRDTYHRFVRDALTSTKLTSCEVRMRRYDRTEFHARLDSIIVSSTAGKDVQFRTVVSDISPLKHVEAELLEKKRFIEKANNTIPDILFIFDITEHYLIYVNEKLISVLGYTADQIRKMGADLYSNLVYPDDLPEVYSYLSRMASSGDNRTSELEVRIKHANSAYRWMYVRSVVFHRSEKGSVQHILGTVSDITFRKHAEKILLEASEELENRVRERTYELEQANETLSAEIHERERIAEELLEKNITLKVLLQQRETDRVELEQNILSTVKSLIQPHIQQLKGSITVPANRACLNIIESNLNDIVSPFTRKLSSAFLNFSQREIEVANLIKNGRQVKEIMEILHISFETVKTHRQNIRKKLGIYGKKTNLRQHLQDISE